MALPDAAEPAKSPPARPAAGADDFQRLRELLLGSTAAAVERLNRRFEDPAALAAEVSDVLPAAIRRRGNDGQLGAALSPAVGEALRAQVKKNPEIIIDVVFPVLGPAIRKWITQSLEDLTATINRTVEHTFSIQGLRWRLEARRTGRRFAEVVLAHSIVYRIEQVLLVHRETGLLLHHVVLRDPVARDPDLVSGMLTAIRAFVRDSFTAGDAAAAGDLREFRVGDLTVVVEDGPHAVLTAVVRGTAPRELRQVMQDVVAAVHREFGDVLRAFDGDADRFLGSEPLLERCLVERRRMQGKSPVGAVVLAGTAAAAVAALVWLWLGARRAEQRWAELVAALRAEPGIVVTDHDRSGRDLHLAGLRDPLAKSPDTIITAHGYAPADLEAAWTPVALPALALERARVILAPPATVTLDRRGEVLIARGAVHSSWIRRSRELVPLIPGIARLSTMELELRDQAGFDAAIAAVQACRLVLPDVPVADLDLGAVVLGEALAAIDDLDAVAYAGGLGARVVVSGRMLPAEHGAGDAPGRRRARAVADVLAAHSWRTTRITVDCSLVDVVTDDDAAPDLRRLITFIAGIERDPDQLR